MTQEHPSRFTLMRYMIGELPSAETSGLDGHLRECECCRTVLDELRSVQIEGQRQAPPLRLPAREPRLAPRLVRHWAPLAAALAAACVALVILVPRITDHREPGLRLKGPRFSVEAFCQEEGRKWPCKDGESLSPGSAVIFELDLREDGFLMLAGRDGTGRWERYFPLQGGDAGLVKAGQRRFLDASLVLDSTPGAEDFYFVVSTKPFAVRPILEKMSSLRSLSEASEALTGMEVRRWRFEKRVSQSEQLDRQGRQDIGSRGDPE